MNRSPFVAILPDGVPMAYPVGTSLEDAIIMASSAAYAVSDDVQIVRDEIVRDGATPLAILRTPLGVVHPDGSWAEA